MSIQRIIKDRGIVELYHFTNVENLQSILCNGIVPRATLNSNQRAFEYNDEIRGDGMLEASCLSISFPNYKLLHTLKCNNAEKKFCLLEVDPSILYSKDCYFFKTNAANHEFTEDIQQIPSKFQGVGALNELFYDKEGLRTRLGIPEYFTTDPQAEVMIKDIIEPRYIKRIIFTNQLIDKTIQKQSPVDIRIEHCSNLLGSRSDWKYWKKQD